MNLPDLVIVLPEATTEGLDQAAVSLRFLGGMQSLLINILSPPFFFFFSPVLLNLHVHHLHKGGNVP